MGVTHFLAVVPLAHPFLSCWCGKMLTWVLGISSTQDGAVTMNKPRSSRESCDQVSLYLQISSGRIDILLVVWVPWFCPIRVDGEGDQSSLFCAVGLIVEVPGFRMGLY